MSAAFLTNESPELRRLWHPVGRCSDFDGKPRRVDLVGEGYVVLRLEDRVRAFRDVCPHRFARLSDGSVIDNHLQCPYHGWRFDADGQCQLVPSLGPGVAPPAARLQSPHVMERYGLVWLAPEDPIADVLRIAEFDDPNLESVWMPAVDIRASAAQAIDNFLDFSHFPFVHTGTFGSTDDALIGDFSTEKSADGWGFTVTYDHRIDNHEDPAVATGEHPLTQPRTMVYDYRVPFSANLRLELPMTGMINSIVMWCQPMTIDSTRVHMVMLRNDCHDHSSREAAIEYEMRVFREDLSVIERLLDTTMPLDRSQIHVRSDRHTVEYRRILGRLFS